MAIESSIPADESPNAPEVEPSSSFNETEFQQMLETANEEQLREVVQAFSDVLGPNHLHTITVTSYLVARLIRDRKYETALPLARHELMYKQRIIPDQPEELQSSMINLGSCLLGLGHHEEAESLFCGALDLSQRTLGPLHPETIHCVDRLASAWASMGEHVKAEQLHRRAVDFNRRLLGPSHVQTVESVISLGECLSDAGKFEEGVGLLQKALGMSIRAHGLQHARSIRGMHALGQALVGAGKHKQARRVLRRTMELAANVLGPTDPVTLLAVRDLSSLLIAMGQHPAGAFPVCHKVLKVSDHVAGHVGSHVGDHVMGEETDEKQPDSRQAMAVVAELLGRMGMHAEAQQLARRALVQVPKGLVQGFEGPVQGPGGCMWFVVGQHHRDAPSANALVQAMRGLVVQ